MSKRQSDSLLIAALGLGFLLGPPFGPGAGVVVAGEAPEAEVRLGAVADELPEAELARQQGLDRPPSGIMRPGQTGGPLIPGTDLTREEIERIDAELLENILRIEDPTERSLALVQAARYKIQTRDLETARRALDRATESIELIADPVRRDLRLISTSKAFVELAQEDINAATSGVAGFLSLEPELTVEERVAALDQALAAFDRAAELAARIGQIGYRPQTQYFVAEQQGIGGQSIGIVAFRNPESLRDQPEVLTELRRLAGEYIDRAAAHAMSIGMPVWRDVALSAVSGAAAVSNQFERSRQVALTIPGLEQRFEALLTVAEAEARRGSPDQGTADYAEAARVLASIPIPDLRGTLNDVLVESLIAAGRFADARRCLPLYPDDVDRLEALGAVAQGMGSRGLSDEAREWILREVEPQNRAGLYRRVNDGVLSTLERYGSDSFLGREAY